MFRCNKMDLRAHISFRWIPGTAMSFDTLNLYPLNTNIPDNVIQPGDSFSAYQSNRTEDLGEKKGGCFLMNKDWCDSENIKMLSCSCSPNNFYQGNLHQSLSQRSTSHHRRVQRVPRWIFAKTWNAHRLAILMLHSLLLQTSIRLTLRRLCLISTNMLTAPQVEQTFWVTTTHQGKMDNYKAAAYNVRIAVKEAKRDYRKKVQGGQSQKHVARTKNNDKQQRAGPLLVKCRWLSSEWA